MAKRKAAAVDNSLVDELKCRREAAAAELKLHAPDWSGDSYPTWREYPVVSGTTEAINALGRVKMLDAALRPGVSEKYRAEMFAHVMSTEEFEPFRELFQKQAAREARYVQTGRLSKKWTPEVSAIVHDYISKNVPARLKKVAEALQVSAWLESELQISITPDYVRKMLTADRKAQRLSVRQ